MGSGVAAFEWLTTVLHGVKYRLGFKFKHSDETRKKISEANKGRTSSMKGKPSWNRGLKLSDETRKKMSLSKVGNKNMLGKKLSLETRKKMSLSKKGKKPYVMTDEIRKHIGDAQRGERSNFWKGGKWKEKYPVEWSKVLREKIRQRDNYLCQMCGSGIGQDNLKFKTHSVHHIDYNKNNLNLNNLITLCHSCHQKTNFNREYWIDYFKIYAENKKRNKI